MSLVLTGFAAMVMIFGKLMLGFILGNIASTLQNAEANRVQYDERLTGIKVLIIGNDTQ
jgi:calcineurin-like phosphoesterase family protein